MVEHVSEEIILLLEMIKHSFLEHIATLTTFTSESSRGIGLQLDKDCWDMYEDSEHGDFFLPEVKKKVIHLVIL